MNKNNTYSIINILIIFIIIIFIFYYISYLSKLKYKESFDNNLSFSYQSGKSGISQTGSIKFDKPFSNIPNVFTQIIGGQGDMSNNSYSVQVFNITPTGFDYSKNKVYDTPVQSENLKNMVVIKLQPDTTQSFMWTAFG
jgi:hypothetical protein